MDASKLSYGAILNTAVPAHLKKRAIERFLRLVIAPLAAIGMILLFATFLMAPQQLFRIVPTISGLFILGISWLLVRKGRPIWGAIVLLGGVCIAILSGMILSGGIHAPIFYGVIPAIVIVTSLFGNRAGLGAAVIAVLISALFVYLEVFEDLPIPPAPNAVYHLTIHVGWLFMGFAAAMIPVALMNQALTASEKHRLEIEQAKLRAEATFHQSYQLMSLLTPDGVVLSANETALDFIGADIKDIEGKPFDQTPWWPIEERARLAKAISSAAGGERTAYKTWHIRSDGRKRTIDFCVGPYRDPEGEIAYLIAEGRDITELFRAQEDLAHREKLESVGQLAGGIAHDFNNMLGGIIGATESIERMTDPKNEALRNAIDVLFTASERAATLAKKLLIFSRRQSGHKERCDFHGVVKDTADLMRYSMDKRIVITVELTPKPAWISGDVSQLQNALVNLCINARDAMPDGGTLKIGTALTDLDETFCKDSAFALQPGSFLQVTVRDTGCGMDEAVQKKVFEPFFTTKELGKGTGLGLSTTYGAVAAHRGAITFYSEPGKGTVFHMFLPLEADGPDASDPSRAMTVFHDHGTVLLVDDEEIILHTGRAMLNAIGYEVMVAPNGAAALELFKQNHQQLKLVILDMMMPEMNGIDTFKQIRMIAPKMKVILASGFSSDAMRQALTKEGVDCFIDKPIRRANLARAIQSVLA